MKNRLVSLTGATGFLGSHLAEAFVRDGWQVRAVVRPGRLRRLPPGVDVVEAPLAPAWLERAFEGSDLVAHCAALIRAPNQAAFDAVNVEGTRAVVRGANAVGARLLHVSSQAAAGPATPARPAREDDPPHPINAYGRSKLAAEQVIRAEARTPWTIVRPGAVYGPRDRGFRPLFQLARRGLFFYAAPPATFFTLMYVDDLIRALLLASTDDRAIDQLFFAGHPEPATADDLLRALAATYGVRYRPRAIAPAVMDAAAGLGELAWRLGRQPVIDRSRLAEFRAGGFVCSVDRMRDVLGYVAPTPLREGVEKTAKSYE